MIKNLVIIGSGPAGDTAAIYAARAGLQPVVIHGAQPGGQLTTTTAVDNYPGFPDGILGPDLMDEMRKHAERFGTEFINEQVESVDLSQRPFKLKVGAQEIEAHALIIACGAKPKLLGLPADAETKLMGKGVSVCATCDGFFFRDKTVFVVGGGDAALEEAITLTRWAKSVTVIHRRDTFRASKIMIDRAMSTEKLSFLYDSVVDEILDPASDSVTAIKVKNVKTGAVQELPADGVFIAIGHIPNTALFQGKLAMNERGYLVTDNTHTNVEGVFAAGDVHDERYRQAVVAAGDGCRAALEAQWFLERGPKLELKTVDNKPAASDEAPVEESQAQAKEQEHAPKHTVDVTVADFEEKVLKSTVPVVVDFWAPWCGPCMAIAPRIEAIAKEFTGRVVVAKFNIDRERDLWDRFNIKGIPTLIVFKDGKEFKRLNGQEPYQELKHEFDQLIAKSLPEMEELAAARAELEAVMKAAKRKYNDANMHAFEDVAKVRCPKEWEPFFKDSEAVWSEADKLIPEVKAKHKAGEMGEFDYLVARVEARRKVHENPAHAELIKSSEASAAALFKAMEPYMAEYDALTKKIENEYNVTVEPARRRFDQRVAELTPAHPQRTFRRRVIFISDNIEKVTIQDTVSVEHAVKVVSTNDLLFPSYVARFSQNRIIVATPMLSVMIEFVGPIEDMYEVFKTLKHRQRPAPKAVLSELEKAVASLH